MQKHLRKILVGVDGSEASKRALDFAISLAEAAHAELTVLEVVEEFGPLPGMYGVPPGGRNRVEWVAEQRFADLYPLLKETAVLWTRQVVQGYPAEEICTAAEKGQHDLIVVGSRGHSGIGRFLVGSVSDRVVHHAPCSVTVVRG